MRVGDREPHFISGLKGARKILEELRVRKVKQLEQSISKTSPLKCETPHIESHPQENEEEKRTDQTPVGSQRVTLKSKTEQLHLKINRVGQQLFNCHSECEGYQVIFQHLVKHYRDHLAIIEENDRQKKKSFQLQENITQYRNKIKRNLEAVEQVKLQEEQAQKIVREELMKYLVCEHQKAMEDAQPVVPLQMVQNKGNRQSGEQEEPNNSNFTLHFQGLKKLVSKKPVSRKAQPQQQQLRRPLYQSQLYSL